MSIPEADGIAPLYSNLLRGEKMGLGDEMGMGGCIPLCALLFFFFFFTLLFSFVSTPDWSETPLAQQRSCIPHLIQSTFILWLSHFNPFFFTLSLPLVSSLVSLLSSPLDPPGTLHIQRQRVMWPELDRYECIFCHALYNETYITCSHATVTVCYSGRLQQKDGLDFSQENGRAHFEIPAAHDGEARTRQ